MDMKCESALQAFHDAVEASKIGPAFPELQRATFKLIAESGDLPETQEAITKELQILGRPFALARAAEYVAQLRQDSANADRSQELGVLEQKLADAWQEVLQSSDFTPKRKILIASATDLFGGRSNCLFDASTNIINDIASAAMDTSPKMP